MPTRKQKNELEALAAIPDEKIDFSDIPEITDKQWTGAVRGLFARPETRHISFRLSAVDLVMANKLAAKAAKIARSPRFADCRMSHISLRSRVSERFF